MISSYFHNALGVTSWVKNATCKDCTLLTDAYASFPKHLLYFLTKAIAAERSITKNDGMLNPTSTAVKAVFGTSNATLDIRGNVMKAKITPTFATVTSEEMRVIVKQVNDYRRKHGIFEESAVLKSRAQVALMKKQAGRKT